MRRLLLRLVEGRGGLLRDTLILGALLAVLLVVYGPVTIGGRSLIPFDALYQYPPFATFAAQQGVGPPHNPLVTDLLLQNYAWKTFAVRQFQSGQIPLWNPFQLAGVPFLAAGQHSVLYPLSLLYYALPLWLAYGWFTLIQTWLAGTLTYAYTRTLGLGRGAAAISAFTYALSQIFLINPVHPMILAGMSWLPLILLAIEGLLRRFGRGERFSLGVTLYATLGAVAVAMTFLAGHIEIALYTLLVAVYYAMCRSLFGDWRFEIRDSRLAEGRDSQMAGHASGQSPIPNPQSPISTLQSLLSSLLPILLGLALAAVLIAPLYELVTQNYRQGGTTLQEARSYAFPPRHLLKFVLPDVFGNPSHHGYYDIFASSWVSDLRNRAGEPVDSLAWGIKNHVEGAVYAGLLPLLLALLAAWHAVQPLNVMLNRYRTKRPSSGMQKSPLVGSEALRLAQDDRGLRPLIWTFAGLAGLSLAFAFGTPLYGLLFILPGFSQLHTPFRWIFPYTFSLAALAGLGWAAIPHHRRFTRRLGGLTVVGGTLGLLAVVLGYAQRDRLLPLADRLVDRLARANEAFSGGAAFLSYEGRVLLLFVVGLLLAGLVLVWAGQEGNHEGHEEHEGGGREGKHGEHVGYKEKGTLGFALVVLAVDLVSASYGFYPATSPALANFTPPALAFLQERQAVEGPFRITVLGDKNILPPNLATIYGLEDTRGYDSIIPRQYVDFSRQLGEQDLLLYNQVAPLRRAEALDSPLLDLLGVRYVLTNRAVNRPGWPLVYDGEVKIYRNNEALPRAFFADTAPFPIALASSPLPLPMGHVGDSAVFAEGQGEGQVTLRSVTPNTLEIDVTRTSAPGALVVADSYYPGWQAFLLPRTPSETLTSPLSQRERGERGSNAEGAKEEAIPIVRAGDNFRAVTIPPGVWRLRLTYSPMSIKVGLYLSFLAAATLAFLIGFALWRRVYGPGDEADTVRRVARNSLAPMLTNLGNKVVDFAFAALMLRVLGPALAGRYYFAIAIVGYLEIWSNFGLNLYLTREVAQRRDQAAPTLARTLALRLILLGLAVPVLLLAMWGWRRAFGLTDDTALAILLLTIALVPGNFAAGLSSLFYAYEKMEYPAGLTSLTTLLKVMLGALVLLLGWGFIGLATVAIVTNIITAFILWRAAGELFLTSGSLPRLVRPSLSPALLWGIVLVSYPLMLNHLLQTLFFKVDVTLLQAFQGDIVVGWYSTAYKWIDALLIIPAYFTLAIFPLMSRLAKESDGPPSGSPPQGGEGGRGGAGSPQGGERTGGTDASSSSQASPSFSEREPVRFAQGRWGRREVRSPISPLARTHLLAARLLLMVALPIAAATTFLAEPLIRLLGGTEYLPHGAIALSIMIWFLPFSFLNGVTQYVLVAVDEARWITRSFVVAVVFNLTANLIFIPRYGYPAAAVITILSELALMVPFLWAVRRHGIPLNPLALAWRPFVASAALFALFALLWGRLPWPLVLLLAGVVYVTVLIVVGGITEEDRRLVRRLLPGGRRVQLKET